LAEKIHTKLLEFICAQIDKRINKHDHSYIEQCRLLPAVVILQK